MESDCSEAGKIASVQYLLPLQSLDSLISTKKCISIAFSSLFESIPEFYRQITNFTCSYNEKELTLA